MTVNGVRQENYLQLRADLFSEAMFEAADAWDTAKAGDANVEKEKAKLLVISTKGDIVGGIGLD
jgi:hypothetical protein